MSFKYRFIFSFVLLEIFFIILIVSINFITINNSSKILIEEKIKSNISFFEELIKIPISIYDIATLDNLVNKSGNISNINSLIILDSQYRILSKRYEYKHESIDSLLNMKKDKTILIDNESYEIKYKELFEDNILIGSFYVIFDTTENYRFINKNKHNTFFIILIEILISTFLSYLIGNNLTKKLTRLSLLAKEIGENKVENIPYLDNKDEIGLLSNSMNDMRINLKNRNKELKESTIELTKQKNFLIQANKYKDDFLANMSHELKTPLNSINIISSVMMKNKNNKLDDKEVKNLKIINSCGNDLLYLINDILDLAKLEAGEIRLDYQELNFKEIIYSIKEMFEPQIKEKNLEFIFEFDSNINFIYSDSHRIKQIIKNILSNALKFVENGSISFIIKNKNENIEVIVKDTGIGIEKEKLEFIFDRFKQVSSSTNRKYGGTGLGLAICKKLLNLLKGDIFVSSEVNKGSTFTIIFPKNSDKVLINNTSQNKIKKDLSKKILLLNDNPLLFFNISIELKKYFEIELTSDMNKFIMLNKSNYYIFSLVNIVDKKEEEIKNIIDNSKNKFVFIYSNELSDDLKEISLFNLKNPINKDIFITNIKKIKV